MKKLENTSARNNKPKQLHQKAYIPHKQEKTKQQELVGENLDASLEAAIEKVTENVTEEAPTEQSAGSSQQSTGRSYTTEERQAQKEVSHTKQVTLSVDNQGLEGVLPTIILPSKLQKLYKQEALLGGIQD